MAKLRNLENKVVWITGASSGLGKALARECALQGAQVVLTSRRYDELEAVRVGLFKPERHVSIAADITDEAQVRHAHEQVLACKGRIDWLINNAGLSQRALIQDTTMQTERAIMEVDYFSQVFFTKTVLPTFLNKSLVGWYLSPVWRAYWVHNIAPVIRRPKRRFICGQTVFAPRFQKMGLRFRWFSQALLKPMSLLMP